MCHACVIDVVKQTLLFRRDRGRGAVATGAPASGNVVDLTRNVAVI